MRQFTFPALGLALLALVLALGAPAAVGAHTVSLVATPVAAGGDFAGLVDIGGGRRRCWV